MTTRNQDPSLADIQSLAEEARAYVANALSIQLDDTDATLPVLDHYLGQVPREPPEIADLVSAAAGCYFGEILRDRFGGAWTQPDADPATWRLVMAEGALTVHPMALAHLAISHGKEDRFEDTLVVIPALQAALGAALERLAPMEESAYYSLSGRFDALETILDLITALREELGEDSP